MSPRQPQDDSEPAEISWWSFILAVLIPIAAVGYGLVILVTGEWRGRRGNVATGPVAGVAFLCIGVYAGIQLIRRFRP